MRSLLKLGGGLCLLALLSACATSARPYNLIDAQARPHIKAVDGVLISKHDDIRADINVSTLSRYVQGHFAPILFDLAVNGVRTYQAGKIMKPINETLDEYDFLQGIQEEFTLAMDDSGLGDMGELKLVRDEELGFRAAYVQNSEADAVMFIDIRCAFTPNFDALHLITQIMVFPTHEALSPYKEKPDTDDILELEDNIYRNQFIVRIPSGADKGSSKSENGEAWAQLSEEELKGLLQRAAQKLAGHIANDLNTDDISDADLGADDAIDTPTEPPSEQSSEPVLN